MKKKQYKKGGVFVLNEQYTGFRLYFTDIIQNFYYI